MLQAEASLQLLLIVLLTSLLYHFAGGTLSNFPMALFHKQPVEGAPTIGVSLGYQRAAPRTITSLKDFVGSMDDTSRHLMDWEFLWNNPEYSDWVAVSGRVPVWAKQLSLLAKRSTLATSQNIHIGQLTHACLGVYQAY